MLKLNYKKLKEEKMNTELLYLDSFVKLMKRIEVEQKDEIVKVAEYLGEIMINNGIIQLYGFGVNGTLPMELEFRAGGFIQYNQLNARDLVLQGKVPNEIFISEDFGKYTQIVDLFFESYNINENDTFLITQISQPNEITESLVQEIKKRGFKFVLITNSLYPELMNSKAFQLADYIIDIKVEYPDNVFTLPSMLKSGPIANLIGNIIAQMLTAEIYKYLVSKEATPNILLSTNITGADAHNKKIGLKYEGRYGS